jgi:hypothetical protein
LSRNADQAKNAVDNLSKKKKQSVNPSTRAVWFVLLILIRFLQECSKRKRDSLNESQRQTKAKNLKNFKEVFVRQFSFLVSRFSFLVSRFSFLVSRFSFLVSRCSLFIARFSFFFNYVNCLQNHYAVPENRNKKRNADTEYNNR